MTTILILLILTFVPSTVLADAYVTGTAVDLSQTLPGNAYYMSAGPIIAAEVSLHIDGIGKSTPMQGSKRLRVTLFEYEGMPSLWVEQVLMGRVGNAWSESCFMLSLSNLGSFCPQGMGRGVPKEVVWLDSATFEFKVVPAFPAVGNQAPQRFRMHWIGDGKFEIDCGPGKGAPRN